MKISLQHLILSAVASLGLIAPAHAGVGMTAYLPTPGECLTLIEVGSAEVVNVSGGGWLCDGTSWAPSIDYRAKGWLVQVHALDTLAALTAKSMRFGFDVSGTAIKKKVANDFEGVFMVGGGFGYYRTGEEGDGSFNFVAKTRLGAERKAGVGLGLYVVPTLGLSTRLTGETKLTYGGGLEVSAWFAK